MRIIPLAAAALLASASTALAAPADVDVVIGAKLQEKAEKTYGVAEVARLADHLRADIVRELAKTGAYDDARVELTLVDVVPNRPTFKQMSDRVGLSMQSFGVGGARIEGQIITPDGRALPVTYRYYETDITNAARAAWTWQDAEWSFDRFARRLAQGQALASR